MRVVFLGAAGNPMGFAWTELLSEICDQATMITPKHNPTGLHGRAEGDVPSLDEAHSLSLDPDVVVHWWGYKSSERIPRAAEIWPRARHVICVDTLPDARWLPGELQELMVYRRMQARIAGFITSSSAMDKDLRRLLAPASIKTIVFPAFFPDAAFPKPGYTLPAELVLAPSDRPRLLFPGRSDHLFSSEPGMRKDACGPLLRQIQEAGCDVYLPSLTSEPLPEGMYRFPYFETEQILSGQFAAYLDQMDWIATFYNAHSRTIKRRVRNALSTRLASATTSTTPWLYSPESEQLVREITDGRRRGFPIQLGAVPDLSKESSASLRVDDSTRRTMSSSRRGPALRAFLDAVSA